LFFDVNWYHSSSAYLIKKTWIVPGLQNFYSEKICLLNTTSPLGGGGLMGVVP
jgi:hypothetical protein